MKRKWFLLLAVVGVIAGSGLLIKPPIADAQSLNYQQPQSQLEKNQCADLSAKNADRKLNQVYQQLLKKQGTESATLLVRAQEDWINYRDASCAFSKQQFAGGSAAPMVHSECLARLTKQRTQELEIDLKESN